MESSSECLKRRMQLLAVDRLPEERLCLLNSFYSESSYESSNYRLSTQCMLVLYARLISIWTYLERTHLLWTSGISFNYSSRWCSSSSLKNITHPVQYSSDASLLKSYCIAFDVSTGNLIEKDCEKELIFVCEVCILYICNVDIVKNLK